MLRIYEVTRDTPSLVRVSIFGEGQNSPVFDRTVGLSVDETGSSDGFLEQPGYAEISGLESLPELDGLRAIRIEIEAADSGSRVWAMASVTHNESQSVAIISPQPAIGRLR